MPEVAEILQEFRDMPVVAISASQCAQRSRLNWQGVIHHGVPETLHRLGNGSGGYLAFLGRFSPEKGVDLAIRTASELGLPLRIAAKCDEADRAYFENTVKPLLGQPHVEFVGEIGEAEKGAFLGEAIALLFPIDWPEPFGMVMVEALACGTPVVALRHGSVPELLEHGVTGAVVDPADGVAGLVRGVQLAQTLDRPSIRQIFERRFTAERMALEYLMLYERLLALPVRLKSSEMVAAFD
jgi:glycosyltransferase involved in cell wall biosynthesis